MKLLLRYWAFLVLVVFAETAIAQNIPARPNPPQLVNDYTGTLTRDQQAALEQKLVAFYDSTSTEIAVVIVQSTEGYEVSEFALKLGRTWGIGGKDNNNGVVLLVAKADRRLNISTGYGLEGALPDLATKYIIDDVITPNFKGNDFYRGLNEGTDAIIKSVQGEYKIPVKKKNKLSPFTLFIIIIGSIVLISMMSGRGGGGGTLGGGNRGYRRGFGPVFFPMGGGFGGSGGGSSGGGFGGFGGGSFGGGGSSGGW